MVVKSNSNNGSVDVRRTNANTSRSKAEAIDRDSVRKRRTVAPSLFLGLGGTGCKIGRKLKALLKSQRTTNMVRLLAIDTDVNAQAGSGEGLSLSPKEFLHCPCDRSQIVAYNPDAHPELHCRFDFDDSEVYALYRNLFSENVSQGGQVRGFGNLALQANWSSVKAGVQAAINELTGVYTGLKRQLSSEDELIIPEELTVNVACSLAGGTGSSMILEVLTLIRSLTASTPCRIVLLLVSPAAFEDVLAGQQVQQKRTLANGYGALTELNAVAMEQLSVEGGLGPGGTNKLSIIPELFNEAFFFETQDASGHVLSGPDAVMDRIVLKIAAEAGTEIRERLNQNAANQATAQRITPDAQTGLRRSVATANATSLSLNTERLADTFGNRNAEEILNGKVLGPEADASCRESATAFCKRPFPNTGLGIIADQVASAFAERQSVNPERTSETLLKQQGRGRRKHHPARRLVPKAQDMMRKFDSTVLPNCRQNLSDQADDYQNRFAAEFQLRLRQLKESDGLLRAHCFAASIAEQLATEAEKAEKLAVTKRQSADSNRRQVEALSAHLSGLYRAWPKDRQRKDSIVNGIGRFMRDCIAREALTAVALMLTGLLVEIREVVKQTEAEIAQVRSRLKTLVQNRETQQQRLTAGTDGELDVTSAETEDGLYADLRPDITDGLEELEQALGCNRCELIHRLAGSAGDYDPAVAFLRAMFTERLAQVSITDVLATQLRHPELRASTAARIKQVVKGCQPLWRAESGQLNTEYSDTMVIGLPAAIRPEDRKLVADELLSAAQRQVNPNGQYRATAQIVETTDNNRVYVVRNTVGACWHYLTEVRRCEAAYREWQEIGGHSVHIFNKETVSRLPSLLPSTSSSEDVDDSPET